MGALRPLALDYQYMSYGRFDHRGTIVVAVNNGDAEVTKTLPVRYCGVPKNAVMERLCLSKEDGFTTEPADLADPCIIHIRDGPKGKSRIHWAIAKR